MVAMHVMVPMGVAAGAKVAGPVGLAKLVANEQVLFGAAGPTMVSASPASPGLLNCVVTPFWNGTAVAVTVKTPAPVKLA